MTVTTPQEALERFAFDLNIPPISHIVKRGTDPRTARFTIVLEDHREIRVGTAKAFSSQADLARAIWVTIDIYPAKIKSEGWTATLRGLSASGAITVEEVEGERYEDTVSEWLTDYLDTDALEADKAGAATQGLPFRKDGQVYVSAQHLAKYIRRQHSEKVDLPELRQALGDLGFEREKISYRRGKKSGSRSYYVVDAQTVTSDDAEDAK